MIPQLRALRGAERRLEGVNSKSRSLVDLFAASSERFPYRLALGGADGELTYLELERAARALERRLRAAGAGRGERVGVRVGGGRAELYVAILGVLMSGAAYVPVDADDPSERAEAIWQLADVCAVVGDDLGISQRRVGSGSPGAPCADDEAWLIFTSGSTGEPKGVAITHRAAAAFVEAEAGILRVLPQDRVLAGFSVAFDASCEEIWLAWRNGAALVAPPRELVRAGAELGPWLREQRVSVASTVPTLAALWDERDLAGVRLLILGGEACPSELGWRLAAAREVWNTYGPTEATVVSTAVQVKPGEPVTIGHPLRGWLVAVIGEDGEPAPLGEPGELVIGGVGLGRYLNPLLDAARYAPLEALGWERAYRTGDLARETAGGLEFLGRRDDQVKVGGRRIELGELDAQLCSVPGVSAAAAALRQTASGNSVLVGYVVGEVEPDAVRAVLAERLPAALVPQIVGLDALPRARSGKIDRRALPWPPPRERGETRLRGTAAWLAERWSEQLGPLCYREDSDFFTMGGTSLAAAKLVSALRERFPSAGVADVYRHRRLGALAERLEQLGERAGVAESSGPRRARAWSPLQLAGVFALVGFGSLPWLAASLAYNQWAGVGPRVGWLGLAAGWLLLASAPGRALIVIAARRLLLPRLAPGRHPRRGWLACRLWFVERLAEVCRLDSLAGTPWAVRYARASGDRVGVGARLATLPPVSGLAQIGAGATIEAEVDLHGWWVEGPDLVLGDVRIGDGARVGTRSVLMPGAQIGAGAEIEPGSVVSGPVPAGERWSGSPAQRVGEAGEGWPAGPPPASAHRRRWRAMYALGLVALAVLPLAAAVPGIAVLAALGAHLGSLRSVVDVSLAAAPLEALCFVLAYALILALSVRGASRLLRPGLHADDGAVAWALWFSESLMERSRTVLFPVYASLFIRPWLRLAGIRVGRRTEVSTALGLSRLVSIGEKSFLTDVVVLGSTRARGGWIEIDPVAVGDRTFLGNGAILTSGTVIGDDCLVGVLSSPPQRSLDGTSWLGLPALELPRVPDRPDPSRTTDPPPRLVALRAAFEVVRILLPTTVSTLLATAAFLALESIGRAANLGVMVASAPFVVAAASLVAVLVAIAVKWSVIGRYRPTERPLWSHYIWRDELVNSCHEQLAGAWALGVAIGTPLMPLYLRAMGASVGRDVWFESIAVSEFDLIHVADGCAINRGGCLETHLVHDRLMRTGPSTLEHDATVGPHTAVLPDTLVGAHTAVGARSIVLRGERLPAHTRWQGAPIASV